ncbi:SprT-like domain-containing protein [Lutimonas saemankumensis]|uniref:SprT-like domain-containing protein n=1 Tax=Lutimonas saemankumensis TaxID=483016 RepID=UPI001CD5E1D6|nr:SprT-like domain-containing protein [Lutimonas saemankumensis]MCA0933853.1 SprT-like domain-containing protein [Lutimonas saemankumensis]
MKTDSKILIKYIPQNALGEVNSLIKKYPCHLKIVKKRSTKHGDFRRYRDGRVQITINNDLNPYRFLITLIHEFAHLVTFREHRDVKPHGAAWKINFKRLMLPFLNPEIFPDEILRSLATYMISPKASTDGDINLSMELRKYDSDTDKTLIFEIPDKSIFQYKNRTFVKERKRRSRFECIEVLTHKKYIFHPHAEVTLLNQ